MSNPIVIRILGMVIVLGLAIFVHEAGHFLLAKRKGVRVEKFAIGFGPKIFSFRRGETEYQLSIIPFGGYIKMAGENPGEREGAPDEFFSKSPFDRIKIVAAGPFMNLLLAYILTVAMLIIGIRVPDYPETSAIPAEIGEVMIGTPAYATGIKAGDKIISIDGERTEDWSKLVEIIHASADKRIELMIDRNGKVFPIKITPISQDMLGESFGIIGIRPPATGYHVERFGWKSIPYALNANASQVVMIYKSLWYIITHLEKARQFVGGPIMMVQMAGEEAKKGVSDFLGFMSIINMFLAIINLMPFPVLDGGHVMFFLLESLRGKSLPLKTQELIQQVCIGVLIALMVFLSANDTLRWVDRKKALRNGEAQSQ